MRFGSLLVLALPAIVACGGGGADESVSGVFPSSAFLGRQMRVEISGDVTEWKAGASVNFGAGVTVQNVAVASPTALFADITVLPDAAPGLRDVTVESGGSKLVLKEAFQLESAITVKFKGTVAQGSIATFAINNHDFDTPFDDTSTGDGFFTPIEYTNTSIVAPAGVTFQIDSVTPYAITGLAFFDLDAAPGPMSVESGIEADLVSSALGVDLDVKARTATPLVSNTPATGTVETSWASALYEFSASGAASLVTFNAASNNGAGQPGVALLGPSGRFDEMIAFSNKNALVQMTPYKLYGIVVDPSGTFGYPFSVRANSQTLSQMPENEAANNTFAAAPMLPAMPSLVTNATLASKTDADWYGLTVTAADVGKTLRVLTTGNDPQTDTVVEVFKANGAAADAFGDPSSDDNYHEDFTSEPLDAPGKYWVKVTASSYFQAAHNAYAAAVWLE